MQEGEKSIREPPLPHCGGTQAVHVFAAIAVSHFIGRNGCRCVAIWIESTASRKLATLSTRFGPPSRIGAEKQLDSLARVCLLDLAAVAGFLKLSFLRV